VSAPSRRLPAVLRRLREEWEYRRFLRAQPPAADDLTVRIAYGNLHATLGPAAPRDVLRHMARQSRAVLRRTQFEIENPVFWSGFAMEGIDHLEGALAQGRGAIVVSGHVGPYRFIPLELANLGYRVEIVVDRRGLEREIGVKEKQGDLGQRLVDAVGRVGYWRLDMVERISVINAEAPDVALRMVKALRAGHVLVVYVDGNTGAGARKAEHVERVPFLGAHVFVRQGIGEIAKLTGAAVVPAFTWRRPLRHVCRFHPAVAARPGESRGEFSRRVLGEVMALFEARLKPAPGEWEEWHHFHRMRDGEASPVVSAPAPDRLPVAPWAVDTYRAFGVSDGANHLVFEPERQRFVKVSKLGLDLVQAMARPRYEAELLQLFAGDHGEVAVLEEVRRLAARGWLERSA
jgi:lauroyl/myristoyl acyltransferase